MPTSEQNLSTPATAHAFPGEHPDEHYAPLQNSVPRWLGEAIPVKRQAFSRVRPGMPEHFKHLPAASHAVLRALIAQQWTVQNKVDRILEKLQDAAGFAEPLLVNALNERFDLPNLDVRKTFLRLYIPLQLGAARIWTVSLLDAALHNFEESETREEAYEADSSFITKPDELGHFQTIAGLKETVGIAGFTRLCRELDIGRKYQEYLEDNLGVTNPVAAAVLRRHVDESQEAALKAALLFARMNRDVQEASALMIEGLMDGLEGLRLNRTSMLCHELSILSTPLTGVLLFSRQLEQTRDTAQIVVYVPDDPEHPIKQYPSTSDFVRELARQLRDPDYQRFFSRFIPHEGRGHFFGQLNASLAQIQWHTPEPGSSLPTWRETPLEAPNLNLAATPIEGDLRQHLYQSRLNKILNDARAIAIPTAQVDQRVRWAFLDSVASTAKSILEVASFVLLPFIPFLGEAMLAYMAWQMLDETFEGIIEWAEGQTAEAFEHVMGAAESLIQLGMFLVGGAIVIGEFRKVLPREIVAFIDRFKPVAGPGGKTLYWKLDLTTYKQKIPLPESSRPNSLGLHQHEGRDILPIEGEHFVVSKDPLSQNHQIEHPTRADAYKPILRGNGDGAWHTELEHPMEWDKATSLDRIGHRVESFSPAQRERMLEISGSSEDALRKMHVNQEPLPPLLADTLERFTIDEQLQRVSEQLASDQPEQYLNADPATQLRILNESGLLPERSRLRLWDEQGQLAWESSTRDDLTPIDLRQDQLIDGDLLKTLLQTLNEGKLNLSTNEAFGNPLNALESRTHALRKKLAQIIRDNKSELFDAHYKALEQSNDPFVQDIVQAHPQLPKSVAQELVNNATGTELLQISEGLLPERLERLASFAEQEVRVTRAYEGLDLDAVANPDTDTLMLRSLETLPGWSREVRLEIRDQFYEAPVADSIGPQDAPIQKVLVRQKSGTFETFDDRGQQLHGASDFYTSVLQALPDAERQALGYQIGQGHKLQRAIHDSPLQRSELRTAIAHPPIPAPPIDTLRLLGTNGYPRLRSEVPRTLAERVRELYPRLSPQENQALVQRLQGHPAGPRAELSRLRDEYFQLLNDLQIWANNPPAFHPQTNARLSPLETAAQIQNRRLLREQLLRGWRKETDLYDAEAGADHGYSIVFSQPILGDLPTLTADYGHISMLSLNGSSAARGIEPFLGRFPGLRRLEMRNFVLNRMPQTISNMTGLDELILSDCGIALTPADQASLGQLHELSVLDLENNPLGFAPEVDALPKLTYIDLSSTGITSIPAGLRNCPRLRTAIFYDNQISELPAFIFELPGDISEGFDFANNPLSATSRERIKIYFGQTGRDLGVFAEQVDIDRVRDLYPGLDREEASDYIYRLPGTLPEGRIVLARKEAELADMISDLTVWSNDVPNVHPETGTPLTADEMYQEHVKRDQFKQDLERCWRRIPTVNAAASEFAFVSTLPIMGDLPALTAGFSHVPELMLTSTGHIAPRASQFLEYFPNLERLTVRGYQLDNIPDSVFRMRSLSELSLPECRITLTEQTRNGLAEMTRLELINLRNNPLGLAPDLSNMTQLSLNLSRCGLTEIPRGLLSNDIRVDADLSFNAITEMPVDLLEVNADIGAGFDFSGNPFTADSLQLIADYYRRTGNDLQIDGIANIPVPVNGVPVNPE